MPLPGWDDLVVGGHDVVGTALPERAERLADGGVLPHRLVEAVADGLRAVDGEIRPGYHPVTHRGSQADAARRLAADITEFRERHGLARVVVVNVSSTEPPAPDVAEHDDLAALERALADPQRAVLPPSSVAAYAALRAGCPFVDFTPSSGIALPALDELARRERLPYAGRDGKTGETLLRTVLAPMFGARALRVRSWAGTNLLGGGDGASFNFTDYGQVGNPCADPPSPAGTVAIVSSGSGSTMRQPLDVVRSRVRSSKCRWADTLYPDSPICCPGFTRSPFATRRFDVCVYRCSSPLSVRMTISLVPASSSRMRAIVPAAIA